MGVGGGQGKIWQKMVKNMQTKYTLGCIIWKELGDGWTGLVLYRDSYVAMALSDGTKQKYINPDDWPI